MENTNQDIYSEVFEENYSPIVAELEAFIDDMRYFVSYSSAVLKFPRLPDKVQSSVEIIHSDAISIIKKFRKYLTEDVEDLERREDELCTEMEILDGVMRRNELILDEYLLFADTRPRIKLQFKNIRTIIISRCAEC
jgi:hypothetical protein